MSVRISTASSTKATLGRDFNFSAALKGKGGTWTYDDLSKFISNPKGFVPGTAMGFAGIQNSERADVIAYLRSLSENRRRCRPRRSNIPPACPGFHVKTARLCLAVFVCNFIALAACRDRFSCFWDLCRI